MTIKSRILLALTAATMGVATLAGTALAGDEQIVKLPDVSGLPADVNPGGPPVLRVVDQLQAEIDRAIRDAVERAAQAKADAEDLAEEYVTPPPSKLCVHSDRVGTPVCIGPLDEGLGIPGDIGVGPITDCVGRLDGGLGIPGDIGVGPITDCLEDFGRMIPTPGDMEGPPIPGDCTVTVVCSERSGI